jgi:hypothetical protein
MDTYLSGWPYLTAPVVLRKSFIGGWDYLAISQGYFFLQKNNPMSIWEILPQSPRNFTGAFG